MDVGLLSLMFVGLCGCVSSEAEGMNDDDDVCVCVYELMLFYLHLSYFTEI